MNRKTEALRDMSVTQSLFAYWLYRASNSDLSVSFTGPHSPLASPKGRGKGVCRTGKQLNKSEFDLDRKQPQKDNLSF